MTGLLARIAGAGLGLWLADRLLVGIALDGPRALALGALVLGGAHALVRPLLLWLTFPITLLTQGLWLWVQNAILLAATAWAVPGVRVGGAVAALLGAAVISATSGLIHRLLRDGVPGE